MSKTGPKHIKQFKEGDRINDSFTLIREIKKEVIWQGKSKNIYIWECKCDCGRIFYARQNQVLKRIGCISCTASKNIVKRSIEKHGMTQRGIKKRIYKDYQIGAKKRNLTFELTLDEFIAISSGNCYYCGEEPSVYPGDVKYMNKINEPWKRNGIDRVDTLKGYTKDNCVPCCSKCNYAKHDLKLDEFKEWVEKCYNNLLKENKKTG